MEANSLVYWIDALKASSGFLFGVFALLIYWRVRSDGDTAMDSFQLNESEVLQDYRIIFFANAMLLAGFISFVLASLGYVSVLIWKIVSVVYILVVMFVLVRWVRMFR